MTTTYVQDTSATRGMSFWSKVEHSRRACCACVNPEVHRSKAKPYAPRIEAGQSTYAPGIVAKRHKQTLMSRHGRMGKELRGSIIAKR